MGKEKENILIKLLSQLKKAKAEEKEQQTQAIMDLLSGEAQLRSNRELIEKFINKHLPKIKDADRIPQAFSVYWNIEKEKAFETICEEEQLETSQLKKVIEKFLFDGRRPIQDAVLKTLKVKPKILKRKTVVQRVTDKIMEFVGMFEDGMGNEDN